MENGTTDEDRDHPLWSRILLALVMLAGGAALGGAVGESWSGALWGALLASPLALLGFFAPGVLGAIFAVLELFSCSF